MKKKNRKLTVRADEVEELGYRSMALRFAGDAPASLDTEARTVEVIGSTENPAQVYDWNRGVVSEVLLMSGLKMPAGRKVVLLDSHSRYETAKVVGSYRDMKTTDGQLVGMAHFSRAADVESVWTKVREGHVTDFSVGYRVDKAVWIEDGESQEIDGRTFTGPVKVSTEWTIRELSVVPIGADEMAKARAGNAQPQNEDNAMNKKMRAFLERRGLPKGATEEEAIAFLEQLDTEARAEVNKLQDGSGLQAPAVTTADVKRSAEEAVRAERVRASEITAMGERFGCGDIARQLISDGKTIDEARAAVMDHLAGKSAADGGAGYRAPVEMGADERDKFRAAATDGLILRIGGSIEKPAAGASDLLGYSMRELARMSLERANQPTGGQPLEMIGRALTTSDFPLILAATANKSLFEGFDTAEETWPIWCGTGSVADFKTHSSVRAGETSDLDEIPESVEYKYGKRSEAQEQYSIATYGKLLAITRQAIINDDLGALSDIPRQHGEAAARKIGDIVYAVLTANAAMGDGVALFHLASHANLQTAAALGISSLGTAINAMKTQQDLTGLRRLNIRPQFYIAPTAVEGASEVFFLSNDYADSDTVATDSSLAATRKNPYAGTKFTRVYESRLDDDSTSNWYLAAARGKTVKVFFLNGQQRPYMETRQGWSVDGVEYKVRIDAGAKAMDWRGLQMTGA